MTLFSNQVNGHALPGEHLTSALDYFTIYTNVDIVNNVTAAVALSGTDASFDQQNGISPPLGATGNNVQGALDKLIEIVSLGGQPVIMGNPQNTVATTIAGVTYAQSLRFASEHYTSWVNNNTAGTYGAGPTDATTVTTNAAANLAAAIAKHGVDFGFNAANAVAVAVSQSL